MSDEADVMKLNMSVVWLNSLCLIGVPLCHACPLQLTVNLLQILSCSDVSIDIHVYLKQTELQFHPFDKTHVPECINPTPSRHSCVWEREASCEEALRANPLLAPWTAHVTRQLTGYEKKIHVKLLKLLWFLLWNTNETRCEEVRLMLTSET